MRVQSVDRATAILREFSVDEPLLGVTQLSDRLDLHKSTVHRLLASLVQGGLVERDPRTRKYRLGTGLIELGYTTANSNKLLQTAWPYLRYLADKLEEVTYLAVQNEDEILNLLQVPGPQLVQSVSWLGRAPLNCTATGKVFLAHKPQDELDTFLQKGLPRVTAKTITDPAALRRELDQVRQQGFATSFEEHQEGVNAIAAPITRPDKEVVIAAVGAVGPTYRFTRDSVLSFGDVVRSIAREISQQLRALPKEVLDLYS